jgi:hypothetical protein
MWGGALKLLAKVHQLSIWPIGGPHVVVELKDGKAMSRWRWFGLGAVFVLSLLWWLAVRPIVQAQDNLPKPPRQPAPQSGLLPIRWPAQLSAAPTDAVTVNGQQYFSSTKLLASWAAPNQRVDHYEVLATEAIGSTSVRASSANANVTLTQLKAGTPYTISLRGCLDADCARYFNADSAAGGTTPEEVWQIQGTGNSMATAKAIVSDGNVGAYAFRFGDWAGPELAGKVQLYYNPMPGNEKGVKTALSSGSGNTAADFAMFTPLSGYGLLRVCQAGGPNNPPPPCVGNSPAAMINLFQAVPVSAELGARVRLFFEATGTDQRTRILYLDSHDGYAGRDFNAGPDTLCRTLADYSAGGSCEPRVAVGVQGDAANGNPRVQNARQFKIIYPQRDDVRWAGAPGTPMIFTVNTDAACTDRGMTQGYAVWDGSRWQVQYAENGCPKLFESVQAPLPVHLGGVSYKLYFSNNTAPRTQPGGGLDNKPMKVIYADGRLTGQPGVIDFEDWETVAQAREVQFIFPDGTPLTLADESRLDDFVIFLPTNNPSLQVMYSNTASPNSPTPPVIGMAVLINP